MALVIGDENCSSGLSSEIYNLMKDEGLIDETPPENSDEQNWNDAVMKAKKFCYVISKAIIEHLKDNAEVKGVTVASNLPPSPVVAPNDGGATLYTSTLYPNLGTINQNNSGNIE